MRRCPVGERPEAIVARSSPGTSLMTRVTTRAGLAAAAKRPPLMPDRCLRTVFISPIVAPLTNSAWLTASLSESVIWPAGMTMRAEPPPEMSATTRSSGPRPSTAPRMRCAASTHAPHRRLRRPHRRSAATPNVPSHHPRFGAPPVPAQTFELWIASTIAAVTSFVIAVPPTSGVRIPAAHTRSTARIRR